MPVTRFQDLPQKRLVAFCELTHQLDEWIRDDDIPETVVRSFEELLSASYCSIQFIRDAQSNPTTLRRRTKGITEDDARKIDRVLVGWVLSHDTLLQSDNLAGDPRLPYFQDLDAARLSWLAVPVRERDAALGVLVAARGLSEPMTDADTFLATTACRLLSSVLKRERELRLLTLDNDRLREEISHQGRFEGLIGQSESWGRVCDAVRAVAPSDEDVLILGETGVGKELCARALHNLSHRKDQPFVSVNCGALTESLAESELFGHVRGAFTGAMQKAAGLFEAANGGTLLLDEIGAAPSTIQSALLRAIQEREIRPVGATETRAINIRILCSTSADLEHMIASGTFRQDLYHRINVVTVSIPPLRDRRDDIPILAQEFLVRAARHHGRDVSSISQEALSCLWGYDWPGNVRELKNCISHALIFTPRAEHVVNLQSLPAHILTATGVRSSSTDRHTGIGLDEVLALHERTLIRAALDKCGWNQSQAARSLHVPEKRIRDRMKKYGLDTT